VWMGGWCRGWLNVMGIGDDGGGNKRRTNERIPRRKRDLGSGIPEPAGGEKRG